MQDKAVCYNPLMKKNKSRLETIHIILIASIVVLAISVALVASIMFTMNDASEDRDNFIMEKLFELQVDKMNRDAEK